MSSLESIVPVAEQQKWLHDLDYAPPGAGVLRDEPNPRHHQQFLKLLDRPDYDQILRLASKYVRTCILYPLSTIQNYWSSTCNTEPDSLLRINMADQVVITIHNSHIYWSVHEIIEPEVDLAALVEKYNLRRQPWGARRIGLVQSSLAEAEYVIDQPDFLYTVRRCNYYLMQKGNLYKNSHNFLLAEALLTPPL
ncbi:MAG TPA: hypothetical protein VHD90_26645 [Phototrophicaceae bacterium]|nr:hypothetical protein [Phototrophicaceae bacterium]